ncbi:unnamed protein product [Rotaria sordida]|uniref:FAD linked oxidase N-terminal domain-containing protein n=1 Tax=Rotaria sordida TaxID=392033 RepID=A0A814SYF6_9BILA|nr:unnamed protein product [Rotaria sordida]
MSRFRQITYHATSQTVDLGAGLLWDDVYQALDPLGVTVVGGQISGVGIAGLILGGGYSRKSNQYGLSIDNAIEYEVTINNQLLYYNSTLGSKPGAWFQITVEPFLPTYFDNSQGGAYPHVPSSTPLLPMNIQFAWALPSDDNVFIDGIKSVTKAIRQAALADCQDVGGSRNRIVDTINI